MLLARYLVQSSEMQTGRALYTDLLRRGNVTKLLDRSAIDWRGGLFWHLRYKPEEIVEEQSH